jgi:U5 small nuclear ribonucleoprotein component
LWSLAERTFAEFILNPIYKIYSVALGEEVEDLTRTLAKLGVKLKHNEAYMDPKPLLRVIFRKFFGAPRGFVSMCAEMFPDPVAGADKKVALTYTGGYNSSVAQVASPESAQQSASETCIPVHFCVLRQ